MRRMVLAAAVLIAAGLVGIAAQLGEAAPGVPRHATALGAPWLIAAFAAGALLRRPLPGALGGAVLLSGGTLSYYVVQLALTGHVRALETGTIAAGWAAAAAVAGGVMGALGAVWREAARLPALAAAVPAATLIGEALLLAGEWRSRTALAVLCAELALATALLPACAWRRASLPVAALAAGALAVVFALGENEVRSAMRAVGWRGA
jgi:hypothetical protein